MTIHINQTPIDFTLEDEKTIGDVVRSLHQWAGEQNLAIVGLLTDGQALTDETAPWSEVKQVEVETVPLQEYGRARAGVIAEYFDLLGRALSQGNQTLTAELRNDYASVRSAIFPLLSPFESRLTAPLQALDGLWGAETAEAARAVAAEAFERERELLDPQAALAETLAAVEASLPPLADLGLLFQKGDDRDAFDLILGLFVKVEDTARRAALYLGSQALDENPWNEYQKALQPFLKETEEALAAADYVLLTDLLEYEVRPRLEELSTLFPGISKLDPARELL